MDKYSVAVIDDNKIFCELVALEIARTEDIELIGVAYNTKDGMQIIQTKLPDLVILDNVFSGPDCENDGIGLLKELGKLHLVKRPKILMISSLTSNDVCETAGKYGADYIMNRGMKLENVIERIRMIRENTLDPTCMEKSTLDSGNKKRSNFQIMTDIMHKIGIPANIKGYEYLRKAVLIAIDDPTTLSGITKVLYPQIASEYNTDSGNVERAIRHAVDTSWKRCDSRILNDLFQPIMDKKKCKPTNSEVIATLSQYILQITKWSNDDESL